MSVNSKWMSDREESPCSTLWTKWLKLTQLMQSTLPIGRLRVKWVDTVKHVVLTAECLQSEGKPSDSTKMKKYKTLIILEIFRFFYFSRCVSLIFPSQLISWLVVRQKRAVFSFVKSGAQPCAIHYKKLGSLWCLYSKQGRVAWNSRWKFPCEYYLKFAIGKTGLVLLVVSCHLWWRQKWQLIKMYLQSARFVSRVF